MEHFFEEGIQSSISEGEISDILIDMDKEKMSEMEFELDPEKMVLYSAILNPKFDDL